MGRYSGANIYHIAGENSALSFIRNHFIDNTIEVHEKNQKLVEVNSKFFSYTGGFDDTGNYVINIVTLTGNSEVSSSQIARDLGIDVNRIQELEPAGYLKRFKVEPKFKQPTN